MESITVERSTWIAAPRERVWQAITDPAQIVAWFLPALPGAALKRDEGGKLVVLLGPMEVDIAQYETQDAPRQASFRSLPDGLFTTTYMLAAENDGTRFTVTLTGFDALPGGEGHDRVRLSGAAWEQALENLKAALDGTALPFPQAAVAPLFGYWREPMEKIAVERSIWIKAPRERVWQAITDPAQIEQWFSPGTQWRGTGLEVGGRLSVYDPATGSDQYVQVIDVVDPPRQLVTRSIPEPPEVPHVTDWTLADEDGGTRLTITHTGYELETGAGRQQNMEQNAFGFGMMLMNVKAVVEGAELPFPGGF